MLRILTLALVLTCLSATAQTKVYWADYLRKGSADTTAIEINQGHELVFDSDASAGVMESVPANRMSDGRLIVNGKLGIYFPKITQPGIPPFVVPGIYLYNLHFKQPVVIQLESNSVNITNCIFEGGLSMNLGRVFSQESADPGRSPGMEIVSSVVRGILEVSVSDYGHVAMFGNKFDLKQAKYNSNLYGISTRGDYFKKVFDTLRIDGEPYVSLDRWVLSIHISGASGFEAENNTFDVPEQFVSKLTVGADAITIRHNRFIGNAIVKPVANVDLVLEQNSFQGAVDMSGAILGQRNQIDWEQLEGKLASRGMKLVFFHNIPASEYIGDTPLTTLSYSDSLELEFIYKGNQPGELLDKRNFDGLVEIHKLLYDHYKLKGNLESSNGCFVAIKDLEGRRLRTIYQQEGGFKNFFGWKLNQLMKFYTNHATEPALALVISVYILIGFAIFYFFFPSEWDVESKGKLIQHYRDFIQKNEHGYVKPFVKMVRGFLLSFVNAFTLSLNAFVTLGFGNIPTKGIARYVCVLEGFIGWFLLSIFTVALINQALF
jgi:hypothetical protein